MTNVNSKTLRPIIVKNASRNSYLMTDENPIYPRICRGFAGHGSVSHATDEYVRGGFWHPIHLNCQTAGREVAANVSAPNLTQDSVFASLDHLWRDLYFVLRLRR